jgi:hypothetical protein
MHSVHYTVRWECDLCGLEQDVIRAPSMLELPPTGWTEKEEQTDPFTKVIKDICPYCGGHDQ